MNNTKKLSGWMILYLLMTLNPINVKAEDSQRIVITSPADGTTISTGSIINIVVEAQPSHIINELVLMWPALSLSKDFPKVIFSSPDFVPPDAGPDDYTIVSNPPYIFTLEIREDASIGKYSIKAIGTVNGSSIQSEPISIIVNPANDPVELREEIGSAYLEYRGDKTSLVIYGNMPDGRRIFLNESPRLQCQSSNPAIVAITSPCDVVAVGEGSATITATVGGVSTTVPVEVKLSIRGDYNGDGDVDSNDIELLTSWRNTVPAPTGDDRDLNNDKKIDALDTRVLTALCTRPRCATY